MTINALKQLSSRLEQDVSQVKQLINHEFDQLGLNSNPSWSDHERIEQLEIIQNQIWDLVDTIGKTQ